MGEPLLAAQRAQAEELDLYALHESDYPLEWMPDPWADVSEAGEWLLELAHEEGVDAVHLNSFSHGALAWPAPVLVAGHSCVCSWWRAVHGEEAPPLWNRYRDEVARGLAGAGAVVAPSAVMLAALRRHYGLRGGTVIANGSSAPARGHSEKQPFVLAAGRFWDPAKNLSALAAAATSLPWPVFAAGPVSGTAPPGLRALGELAADELLELREEAAIFAAPARYEPFGLSALEAARAGCALVLGDIPSLREVWGDAAVYADPGNPAHLHGQLSHLIEHDRVRREMAGRARARARRYSVARMTGAYLQLYRRIGSRMAVAA
jgi:glycosyltransferase involved in cell wall biosynthesis